MSALFHQYYDALFQKKDYEAETQLAWQQTEELMGKPPERVLEIGCGTGNHTLSLAKRASTIVALDIDEKMTTIARQKLEENAVQNVMIIDCPVEDVNEKDFDLAVALFNVVTYIQTPEALSSFFRGIAGRLVPNGVFIFDCWNGTAALLDPPKEKTMSIEEDGKSIECRITPVTNEAKMQTVLTYHLTVTDGEDTEEEDYHLTQKLWTPKQIRAAVENAGLEVVSSFPHMQPGKPVTEQDWKIMFVCQKVSP